MRAPTPAIFQHKNRRNQDGAYGVNRRHAAFKYTMTTRPASKHKKGH